jgi:Cd2+/Zn2+-exporting ATPase
MSTPVATAAAIGWAGKHGILIKGGVHLEHLGRIRVAAFDKTGTLTAGKPVVTDLITLNGSPGELLAVAAGIEHGSEHPLARAVLEKARAEGLTLRSMQEFEALTGVGATAVSSDGVRWYVGSPALFEELGIPLDTVREKVQAEQAQGKTVVLVGTNHNLYGLLILQDRVRDGVKDVILDLRRLGLRAVMLTGDNASTARTVAESLGLDDSLADLKPKDKVEAVKELERCHGPVLMADDLAKVPEVLRLALRAKRISTQNIVFSLLLLAVLIPLAVGGVLSVAWTVVVHEVSELIAVANGLRVARTA